MSAIIGFFLANPSAFLALAGAAALSIFGLVMRQDGKKAERQKQAARDAKAMGERLEMNREATEAERKARDLPDEEARREALKWAKR